MGKTVIRYCILAVLGALFLTLVCCGGGGNVSRRLDVAERVMEEHPDSALAILDAVDTDSLGSKKEKARYALLMSMALDKNYIDTTDFKVLQPAIDYYLKKGTPDEKLKTLYYQGRIFRNADKLDSAMMCYLKAVDVDGVTDSLAYARLLVAQGILYSLQYKFEETIENNLKAARLNHTYGLSDMELSNYARALVAVLSMEKNDKNKKKADSLYQICKNFKAQHHECKNDIDTEILSYIILYGNKNDIRGYLNKLSGFDYPDYMKMDIAKGYSKIGDGKTALQYLDSVDEQYIQLSGDSIKYHLLRSEAEELEGDYISAIRSYKQGIDKIMNLHGNLLEHGLPFSDEKHKLEIENLEEVQKRSVLKWEATGIILLLIIIIGFVYYRYKLIRSKKEIAEQKRVVAEQEKLLAEQNRIVAEHQKMTAEREKQIAEQQKVIADQENQKLMLEQENLRLEIEKLISEQANLNELLDKQKNIAAPLQSIIKERLKMLNGILAKEITSDPAYMKDYTYWIKSFQNDKGLFIKSTEEVLRASYPGFMEYIDSCGLSEIEMKYVCLLAIGFRSKDIGTYFDSTRNYVVNSGIRKKLEFEKNKGTINIFINELMDKLG